MITVFVVYLVIHFLLYLGVLRKLEGFRKEGVIFFYHFIPAVIVLFFVLAASLLSPFEGSLAFILLAVSVHGIYSLSFLELWSLAQGGYSISMLIRVDDATKRGAELDQIALENIGSGKKTSRLDALQRLQLLETHGPVIRLTRRGTIVAGFLSGLSWLANLRETG